MDWYRSTVVMVIEILAVGDWCDVWVVTRPLRPSDISPVSRGNLDVSDYGAADY